MASSPPPSHSILSNVDGLPSPALLAKELRHLDGFVFFDSSSLEAGESQSPQERYSLITALPTRVIIGSLLSEDDFAVLSSAYEEGRHRPERSPDLGFPTDGLYGYITYKGDFVFGVYDHCLIFDHAEETWFEKGTLSTQRQRCPVETSVTLGPFEQTITREDFCEMVATAQEYIAAGDIYQVNLSHRFSAPVPDQFDAFHFYESLRDQSPAPYSAFLSLGGREIISSSPEQFLRISDRTIQTRPIKGTRPRFRDREQDEKSAYDLITSPKEVAELIMITDLERNDLGQICEFGSVEATELLKLERFAQVFHLVSTIQGTLRTDISPLEAVRACSPGGSITGAPKKRATEIIAELEPIPRGVYTGSLGCFGFNGEAHFNIAIRTAVREGDRLHFHVGAGIVADSDPEKEWDETLHKATGIFQAAGS